MKRIRDCTHAYCNQRAEQLVRFMDGAIGAYCNEHTELVNQAFVVVQSRPLTKGETRSGCYTGARI